MPWDARECQGYFWTGRPGGVLVAWKIKWKGKTTLDMVTMRTTRKSQMEENTRPSANLGLAASPQVDSKTGDHGEMWPHGGQNRGLHLH